MVEEGVTFEPLPWEARGLDGLELPSEKSIDPVKIGVYEPRRVIGNVFGLDQLNILLKELQGWEGMLLP